MTRRTARRLGRRGRPAPARRRARRRRLGARLRRGLVAAVVVAGAAVGAAALWRARPPRETSPGGLRGSDQRRAEAPLSEDARAWLAAHRGDVRRIAAAFDVSPIALGGVVAAEKTWLTGRLDAVGEELFRTVFGSLGEADLERWAAAQEREYQRRLARGGGRPTLLTPYLWTLGPAQVSLRLAILYEPQAASRMGRPERNVKQVLEAVMTTPGNLEYAAALLADAQRAYAEVAGIDIARDPGLLATLYHLGSPTARARRLATATAGPPPASGAGGSPAPRPRMNWYGAFVDRHADEIAALLDLPPEGPPDSGSPRGGR